MQVLALQAWPDGSVNYWACGPYHDDSRVFKLALEATQLAHTALHDWRDEDCYRPTHEHTPLPKWAKESPANLQQILVYGLGCLASAERRYGKTYPKLRHRLEWALRRLPDLRDAELTPQPVTVYDEHKTGDIISSYRNHFEAKPQRWKRRKKPNLSLDKLSATQ